MDLSHEMEVACAIAREGGALILSYRQAWHPPPPGTPLPDRTSPQGVPFQLKAGNEPVTEADKAVNTLCVSRLRAAFPGDGLLTEELPDDGSRHHKARTWLVDPIDGTKDLIAGRPGFSLMIGLLAQGRPVLGVVYLPLTGELYHAVAGQGAYREGGPGPAGGPGDHERLHVSAISELREARMVSSASHPAPEVARLRDAAGIRDEVNIGSVGIKLSLIAAGERDLYFNPWSRTKLWDTCAPEVILHEAGGLLTDTQGNPLSYAGEQLNHGHGLVASNGLLHQQAIERLRPILQAG